MPPDLNRKSEPATRPQTTQYTIETKRRINARAAPAFATAKQIAEIFGVKLDSSFNPRLCFRRGETAGVRSGDASTIYGGYFANRFVFASSFESFRILGSVNCVFTGVRDFANVPGKPRLLLDRGNSFRLNCIRFCRLVGAKNRLWFIGHRTKGFSKSIGILVPWCSIRVSASR